MHMLANNAAKNNNSETSNYETGGRPDSNYHRVGSMILNDSMEELLRVLSLQ
jgi:hypothetical protein